MNRAELEQANKDLQANNNELRAEVERLRTNLNAAMKSARKWKAAFHEQCDEMSRLTGNDVYEEED